MNKNQLDTLLLQELERLPDGIAPTKDLWAGIDHNLNKPVKPSHFKPWLVVASVALIGLLVSFSVLTPKPSPNRAEIAALITLLQSDHQENKQAMLVSFQNNTPAYQEWEVQMQQLEDAEALVYEALLEDPENRALLDILRQVQRKQLELIDSVFTPALFII